MPTLNIILLLLIITLSGNPSNHVAVWLEAPTTMHLEAGFDKVTGSLQCSLEVKNAFTGEIALISEDGMAVHQSYHDLDQGTHLLNLKGNQQKIGEYLLILHDFEERETITFKLVVRLKNLKP